MLFVKVRRAVQGEEKLAMVGTRPVLVCHRHLAAVVELNSRVNFVPKRFAVHALSAVALTRRIAPLNHKLANDAVKHCVVIILVLEAGYQRRVVRGSVLGRVGAGMISKCRGLGASQDMVRRKLVWKTTPDCHDF